MRPTLHKHPARGRGRGRRAALATIPLLVCGALLASTSAALAGVIVDPNGPASKQYSADLERTRQQAGGGGGNAGVPGSGSQAPLFGKGVTSKSASPSSRDGQGGGDGSSGSKATSSNTSSIGPSGGGNNALAIAAISIGVLLGGGLIALAVRRGGVGGPT
jgi:hypothetical protein